MQEHLYQEKNYERWFLYLIMGVWWIYMLLIPISDMYRYVCYDCGTHSVTEDEIRKHAEIAHGEIINIGKFSEDEVIEKQVRWKNYFLFSFNNDKSKLFKRHVVFPQFKLNDFDNFYANFSSISWHDRISKVNYVFVNQVEQILDYQQNKFDQVSNSNDISIEISSEEEDEECVSRISVRNVDTHLLMFPKCIFRRLINFLFCRWDVQTIDWGQ